MNKIQSAICATVGLYFDAILKKKHAIKGRVVRVSGRNPWIIDVEPIEYQTDIVEVDLDNQPLPIIAGIKVTSQQAPGKPKLGDKVYIGFVNGEEDKPYVMQVLL